MSVTPEAAEVIKTTFPSALTADLDIVLARLPPSRSSGDVYGQPVLIDGHREARLLVVDEPVHGHRIPSVSRAKKAAAFFRISGSMVERPHPPPQLGQLGPLVGRQTGRRAVIDVGLQDPAWERFVGDPEVVRDLADLMAGLTGQADGLSPELGRVRRLGVRHLDSRFGT